MEDEIVKTIEAAQAQGRRIIANATDDAHRILHETGTWIVAANSQSWFWRKAKNATCGNPRIKRATDYLLGPAAECYCCSAIRFGLMGFIAGVMFCFGLAYPLLHW